MTGSTATLTPANWQLEDCERQILDNLLADEVTRGLGAAEADELQLLLRCARGAEGAARGEADIDCLDPDPLLEDLHRAAAAAQLCLVERARRTNGEAAEIASMPATVEADLRALATQEAKRLAAGKVLPFEQASIYRPGLSPAWWVAAAALFLAVLAWWPRNESPNPSTSGSNGSETIIAEAPVAPSLANRVETQTLAFTTTGDESASEASGRMLWNPSLQRGEMHIDGLAVNDPSEFQYQLWIFDAQRDERYPVDGGVFDVDGESVVVAVNPPVPVNEATLFAITVEPPGGVVVSDRERIALVASPEGTA